MCSCDFDAPEFYTETLRVARKEHRCEECGETIRRGDLYQVSYGVMDGESYGSKMCGSCKTIANLAKALHDGPFCYALGGLLEAVHECFPEVFWDDEEDIDEAA